jgi:sugar porter (SP) family MFS transporter
MNKHIDLNTSAAWQIPISLQMVSGAILVAGMFTVPESVRWLVKQGREEEGWASLTWVRASDDAAVRAEFAEIKRAIDEDRATKAGLQWSELATKENRGRVVSGCLAFMFQQATGASALAYFSPKFFGIIAGENVDRSLLLTALFGAVKLIACSFFVLVVASRVGRRGPLVVGGVVLFCCLFPVSMIQKFVVVPENAGDEPVPPTGIAMVFLIFLNVMVYNLSWGPVPWVYVPEIFPNRVRERGVGICLTFHWLFNFVFTFSTPYMIDGTGQNGWGTFLFYALFDLIMATWAFFFMIETHGKSLEKVQREIDHHGINRHQNVDDSSDAEIVGANGANGEAHVEAVEDDGVAKTHD